MAKRTKTAGQTATTATTTTAATNPIMGTMRLSLVAARKYNNKKAITRDFVAGNPKVKDADVTFETWCKAIADIYRAVEPWAIGFNDVNAKDCDLQAIYDSVVPMWLALANDVDPKMFVRTNDVHRIMGFALKFGGTTNGSVDVIASNTEFRRAVETMIGIRIAQGAVLTEEEISLVNKYDKTVTNIDKANSRLNGYTNSKGDHKKGLCDMLETAKANFAKMREQLLKLGIKEEDVDDCELISGYVNKVDEIENAISKTKNKIAEYNEFIKDNKKKYETIMKKVNEISE